ncbi:MAG: hypothetical protein AAF125_07360 [Chloroflexota bacterium]
MRHQVAIVLLVVGLATGAYGYPLPFDIATPAVAFGGLVIFVAYIYAARTLLRLPTALFLARRRYRHARDTYQLSPSDARQDALLRGFLDTRFWDGRFQAITDRFLLILIAWYGVQPDNRLIVTIVGLLGILLLVVLYALRGDFSGLVTDGLRGKGRRLPGNIPNLRPPPDNF